MTLIDLFSNSLLFSYSSALLLIVIFAIRYFLNKKVSPTWCFYIWLPLLVHFFIPSNFTAQINVKSFDPIPLIWEGTSELEKNNKVASEVDKETQDVYFIDPVKHSIQNDFFYVLSLVWILGVIFLFLNMVFEYLKLERSIIKNRPVIFEEISEIFQDCKQKMKVYAPIDIVESNLIHSPALLGFLRPRLLLPKGFIRRFDKEELKCIFYHELGHMRRWDIVVNWCLGLMQIYVWYNPLIWFAISKVKEDCEVACDEVALKHGSDVNYKKYGKTLIRLIESSVFSRGVGGLVGIMEIKNGFKNRILNIKQSQKKKKRYIMAPFFVLLILLSLMGFTLEDDGVIARLPKKEYYGVERSEVILKERFLKPYVGIYELTDDIIVDVYLIDKQLHAEVTGYQVCKIFPEVGHKFFSKDVDTQLMFQIKNGRVNSVKIRQDGMDLYAKRKGLVDGEDAQAPVVHNVNLSEYVGHYEIFKYIDFKVVLEEEQLYAVFANKPRLPIYLEKKDLFLIKVSDGKIEFQRNSKGRIEEVVIYQDGSIFKGVRKAES